MTIIEWLLVAAAVLGALILITLAIDELISGSSSYAEAQIWAHAARQQLHLYLHRFEVRRDAERVRRELRDELK